MNFLFVKFRAVCYTRGETKTSDIRMPGMDGMELMQRLNQDHPEIKIVILSGYSDFEYLNMSIKNHVAEYLLKPTDFEREAVRNLARNRYDYHDNTGCFPHAKANVETRGESVFAARNAIDGVIYPSCHGRYPFESWGINRDPNACWELDFGRPVRAETLILTTRADFPHDAWWTQARLTLSTGEERILPLSKTAEGQLFDLNGVVITGLKLDQLIKADDPSPFPALTQVEVFGSSKL